MSVIVFSTVDVSAHSSDESPRAVTRSLRITQVSPTRSVVVAEGGRNRGLTLGNRGVVMHDGKPIAAAEVLYLEDDTCGLRTASVTTRPRPGDMVLVVAGQPAGQVPVDAADGMNLRGEISTVGPGARWAWLDGGATHGWRADDTLVIQRHGQPIATGRIAHIDDDDALVRVRQPNVYGRRPRPGDRVERIRSPATPGWVTRVAGVAESGGGQRVLLAAMPRFGISIRDRLDIFRDNTYVGFGRVVSWEADGAIAETEPSFCRDSVQPGDVAIARPPAAASVPRAGVIFRIEGDYALLSLGEADGVRLGTELLLDRDPFVILTADAVYANHCGARCLGANHDRATPAQRWEAVTFGHPAHEPSADPAPPCEPFGTDWLIAVPADSASVAVGRPVVIHAPTPRAGLVIVRTEQQVIVYVVDEWYALPRLTRP